VSLSSIDRGCTAVDSSHGTFASKVFTEEKCESRTAISNEGDDGSIVSQGWQPT